MIQILNTSQINKNFKIERCFFGDVYEITRRRLIDERGFLERMYCLESFNEIFPNGINQINRTHTKKSGTVRGLHYQLPPSSEYKIVNCIRGEVYDVVLDLREMSNTFGQWQSVKLSADKNNFLVIPAGMAHGFQTLTDNVEIIYFHDAAYNSKLERGVNFFDPKLGIRFPLSVKSISERDQAFPFVNDISGIKI